MADSKPPAGTSNLEQADYDLMASLLRQNSDYVLFIKMEYDSMLSGPQGSLKFDFAGLGDGGNTSTPLPPISNDSPFSGLGGGYGVPLTPSLNRNTHLLPQVPKISSFSGDESPQRGETTYEGWRYEVRCLASDSTLSEELVLQAIRKSLRGIARQTLIPLGPMATLDEVLKKLDTFFGNVASNEVVLQQFYSATQKEGESVTAFVCRLEALLQLAINSGHVSPSARDDMIRSKFWTGLRCDRLKGQTRHKYDSIKSYDLLLREVRAVDLELNPAQKAANKPTKAKAQHSPIQVSESDKKPDKLSEQVSALMTTIKSLEKKLEGT
ncbi:paraneoplastic antigen Ma2 homolog, partial [Pecten maximus]|uniref:paraneoplastic antigen Ma2 homolog n=1 Tax=Pecten maximus TaxID=6579 RepID=UPI001458C3CE